MNDPLLFIDSIASIDESESNQEYYDSRNKQKHQRARYRLEDIEAMLYYRIHVLAEILTKDKRFEGVVEECGEEGITIMTEEGKKFISIFDIVKINILKL